MASVRSMYRSSVMYLEQALGAFEIHREIEPHSKLQLGREL